MGATENVFVEQLVSRHSIEELMVQMNKRESKIVLYANTDEMKEFQSEYYGKDLSNKETDVNAQAKIQFLLSNVKLIKPKIQKRSRKRQNEISEKKTKAVKFRL